MLTATGPKRIFPVVRHLSWRLSSLLVRTSVTANQVTIAGIVAGLLGVWFFTQSGLAAPLLGAGCFAILYLFDHCDGEVARLKGIESRFGDKLSETGGWLVHSALFIALGWKTAQDRTDELWFWFGIIAAAGATMNFAVLFFRKNVPAKVGHDLSNTLSPSDLTEEVHWKNKVIYVYRELAHADFWIVLLVLAVFDGLWLLLPFAAVGSHVYWLALLAMNADKYHV